MGQVTCSGQYQRVFLERKLPQYSSVQQPKHMPYSCLRPRQMAKPTRSDPSATVGSRTSIEPTNPKHSRVLTILLRTSTSFRFIEKDNVRTIVYVRFAKLFGSVWRAKARIGCVIVPELYETPTIGALFAITSHLSRRTSEKGILIQLRRASYTSEIYQQVPLVCIAALTG